MIEYYYEIKHSRFYSYIFCVQNIEEFNNKLASIKALHKKATHCIYIIKIYNDTISFFKKNDGGEPKGYATKQMVKLIQKDNLNNIAFIIIRYYGGIKLGGNKLVQVYQRITNETYALFKKKII